MHEAKSRYNLDAIGLCHSDQNVIIQLVRASLFSLSLFSAPLHNTKHTVFFAISCVSQWLLVLPLPPSQHIRFYQFSSVVFSHFHAIILPLWLFIFDFGHFSYFVVVRRRSPSIWHFSYIHFDFDLFAKEQNKNLSFYYLPLQSCSRPFPSFGANSTEHYVICNHIDQGFSILYSYMHIHININ